MESKTKENLIPISHRLAKSATEAAAELIREAIIGGRLEPGQRLKEAELAKDFGISRTPVREALLVLQAEGLLDGEPNRSAMVPSYESSELSAVYELRAHLESYAARRASTRIGTEQLEELVRSCDRFENLRREERFPELVQENLLFHAIVIRAAESEQLERMVRSVTAIPLVYRSYYWYSSDERLVAEHHHRQLTTALESRDAERAELVMKQHILEARDVLVAHASSGPQAELEPATGDVSR